MGTNKHAQIRYHALDRCFNNFGRKFFIGDLIEACNEAIYDFTGKHEGVKKRQVYDDIKFMESIHGWSIELDRIKDGKNVYHRYSDKNFTINKSPLNQVEISQIKEVLLTLSRFRGLPQFEWIEEITSRLQNLSKGGFQDVDNVIDFEQNQFLKGLNFISPLFNAIYNKRVLKIVYAPFKVKKEITYIFHPYYLKQFNLRWFVFGFTGSATQITNLALDRILSVVETPENYIDNKDINFNEYFDDIIGVSIPMNAKVEKIVLSVSVDLLPYLETKPIHGSQKNAKVTPEGMTIELNLIINYELVAKLFSFGDGIKVLEPQHLAKTMAEKALAILNKYK